MLKKAHHCNFPLTHIRDLLNINGCNNNFIMFYIAFNVIISIIMQNTTGAMKMRNLYVHNNVKMNMNVTRLAVKVLKDKNFLFMIYDREDDGRRERHAKHLDWKILFSRSLDSSILMLKSFSYKMEFFFKGGCKRWKFLLCWNFFPSHKN